MNGGGSFWGCFFFLFEFHFSRCAGTGTRSSQKLAAAQQESYGMNMEYTPLYDSGSSFGHAVELHCNGEVARQVTR